MRIFIQDDNGHLLASIVDGEVYSILGYNDRDRVAFEMFKVLQSLTRATPAVALGDSILTDDVEGGTP